MTSTSNLRAVLLRTPAADSARLLEPWLRSHGVEIAVLDHVYDACTYLLRFASRIPDLIFIDCDSFRPSDLRIVTYLRETWPTSALVLIGHAAGYVAVDRPSRMLAVPLAAMLTIRIPTDVLREARAGGPSREVAERIVESKIVPPAVGPVTVRADQSLRTADDAAHLPPETGGVADFDFTWGGETN